MFEGPWFETARGKKISSKAAGENPKNQLNSKRNIVKTQARNPSKMSSDLIIVHTSFIYNCEHFVEGKASIPDQYFSPTMVALGSVTEVVTSVSHNK